MFKDQLAESGHRKTKENIIPRGKLRLVENDPKTELAFIFKNSEVRGDVLQLIDLWHQGNWTRHIGPSQNRGPAQCLPTSKFGFMDNYSLDFISKVMVCLLDHYNMMKSDFFSLYPISIIK